MKTCPSCSRTTRRELLAGAGAYAALMALARRGDAEILSDPVTPRGTARTLVLVNLMGAPSHLDTFDVKDAPWNPADANLKPLGGGIVLSQTFFPELSRFASDLLLVRSVSSWEAAHERGQFYLQTAHQSNPAFLAETPNIGAVVSLEKGGSGKLPPFLNLNAAGTVQGATFLGGRYEPFDAPTNSSFNTIKHEFFGSQSQQRFEERFALLGELEAETRASPPDKRIEKHVAFYESAKPLMYDAGVDAVFRLTSDETARYGSTNFGNACVVARNVIRANVGASFIHIANGSWDTHQSMFDRTYPGNFYSLT